MALSPFPTTATERTAAIAMLREAVAGRADESDDAAAHLGEVASALIENYAPGAPQALKDEAVIRFAGYLAQADFGTISKETVGPRDVEYPLNHSAMFRNCGAAALLTRWRVRRAGAIG